jgi:hypothetical protein
MFTKDPTDVASQMLPRVLSRMRGGLEDPLHHVIAGAVSALSLLLVEDKTGHEGVIYVFFKGVEALYRKVMCSCSC